jgi:hypothetical protein
MEYAPLVAHYGDETRSGRPSLSELGARGILTFWKGRATPHHAQICDGDQEQMTFSCPRKRDKSGHCEVRVVEGGPAL